MSKIKGATLISEFLVKEKIPYAFGICGHGNVGLLDGLYEVRDKLKLLSPRHEQVGAHGGRVFTREAPAGRHPDLESRGFTVTKSEGFKGALANAVALGKPCRIDVHFDANIRPPATGASALPPISAARCPIPCCARRQPARG